MSLLKVLSTPWLLRRLVKANEKAADALEDIAASLRIKFGIARTPIEASSEDDSDYSVSSDHDTFEREEGPRRRTRRYEDE